jgi:omega-6 fatty acid desaturase (delta-12 desaturase)
MILAATAGVWLLQHQFETTVWSGSRDWYHQHTALYGSNYNLPAGLRWFSANIGLHHVHHHSSLIPFYRLPRVLDGYPDLHGVSRSTRMQSFRRLALALWDEADQRLVTFRDA